MASSPTSAMASSPRTKVAAATSATKIRSGPRSAVKESGLPPFQRLIDTYSEDIWRLLLASVGREEAEDCFQETFISALRAYPKLRGSRDRHNLRAWLLTIAHHKALDVHRARARHAIPVDPASAAEVADHDGQPGKQAQHGLSASSGGPSMASHNQELWDAVHALPDRQRATVILRFTADLPHRDIAAAIGCSEEAARRSLHEGLSRLRREMAV